VNDELESVQDPYLHTSPDLGILLTCSNEQQAYSKGGFVIHAKVVYRMRKFCLYAVYRTRYITIRKVPLLFKNLKTVWILNICVSPNRFVYFVQLQPH
jgi:hypothetical protein